MGGSVSIQNETPYTWSYCYSYKGTSPNLKGNGTLYRFQSREHQQEAFHSYIYIKYGCHDGQTCYVSKDIIYEYYAKRKPVFKIRESSDRSRIELVQVLPRSPDVGACPSCIASVVASPTTRIDLSDPFPVTLWLPPILESGEE
ncbi:UNVERIFIED_CONTAM: hypothetical protein FKN15_004941 [Acipenser sinensis]